MLYLFGAKIRLFLVTSKVLGKKYLKRMRRKKKIGGSGIESRLLIFSLFDEANAYFFVITHFA